MSAGLGTISFRDPTAPSAPGKTPGDRGRYPDRSSQSVTLSHGSPPMGQISARLLKRLGKARKLTSELRREVGPVRDALDAFKHGATARLSHGVALDPLHAAYVAVQNLTSVFA